MADDDSKDLKRRTQSDKVLQDKAFAIVNNPKYVGYQRGLASMAYKFIDKKTKGTGIKNEIKEKQQLPNELHETIVKKFKKRKVYSSFKDKSAINYVLLICLVNMLLRFLSKTKEELLLLMHFRVF